MTYASTKHCAWCGAMFVAKHPRHKCCSAPCSNGYNKRRSRERWPAYYAANRERIAAGHAARYAAHRDEKLRQIAEWRARRAATMTEADRERLLARRREFDRSRRLVRKVCNEWNVNTAEARAMIERGTFPP